MAVADDLVQLMVGQLEEALGFAITVVFQTLVVQYGVCEGNRYRRAIASHDIAFRRRTVFSPGKRGQEPAGLTFKKLGPTHQTLGSAHHRLYVDLGHCMQLV